MPIVSIFALNDFAGSCEGMKIVNGSTVLFTLISFPDASEITKFKIGPDA